MLGRREGGGGWAPGSRVPLRAPLLALRTPPSRLCGAELGARGLPGAGEGPAGREEGAGGSAARAGAGRQVRRQPGLEAAAAATGEAGRLCPSRIFLRSGLAVHNSIAGSPYPKKHSRRALPSTTRQPPASDRRSPHLPEAAPSETSPAFPPLSAEEPVLLSLSLLRSRGLGHPLSLPVDPPPPTF